MFLSLDGTFWIQLINFAIFFAILNVVFMRPVGEAIKKRRAYIDSVIRAISSDTRAKRARYVRTPSKNAAPHGAPPRKPSPRLGRVPRKNPDG